MAASQPSASESVAAVIPVYHESPESIERTVRALLTQTHPIAHVVVVDDGSNPPAVVAQESAAAVSVLRLQENVGTAAALNQGAATVDTDYLLIVGCDVVLDSAWVENALAFLADRPDVGLVSGPIHPNAGRRHIVNWRMHFIEPKVHRTATVPTSTNWLAGHVHFLRRRDFEAVGGFEPSLALRGEDWALSRAIADLGYELYHLPQLRATTYEPTSLENMAQKTVRNAGWDLRRRDPPPAETRPVKALPASVSMLGVFANHTARNLARRRFTLVPVDAAITARALAMIWQATRSRPR